MSKVTADAMGRPQAPSRPPVTDIFQWVEQFFLMAVLISTRFPHKAPELFAYQAPRLSGPRETTRLDARWRTTASLGERPS